MARPKDAADGGGGQRGHRGLGSALNLRGGCGGQRGASVSTQGFLGSKCTHGHLQSQQQPAASKETTHAFV